MSTAVADKASIEAALTGLGYKEIENDLPGEQRPTTRRHKTYTFQYGEPDSRSVAQGTKATSRLYVLTFYFKKDKNNTHASNQDLLEQVVETIKGLDSYANIENFPYVQKDTDTDPTYNDFAEFQFYFGFRTC